MKIDKNLIDELVIQELGTRLKEKRFTEKLSQADLAENAGISKRTVERIESGQSIQLSNLIRIFRTLDLLSMLNMAIPEVTERPIDLMKLHGKSRQRVSRGRKLDKSKKEWQWGDE